MVREDTNQGCEFTTWRKNTELTMCVSVPVPSVN